MFTEIALITAVVTAAACAPLIALLRHKGHHDVPNERSSHAIPTPRGGGIAVLLGAAVACRVVATAAAPPWSSATWAALGAAAALAALGLADDVRDLSPILRLLMQVAVGVLAGAALGGLTGALIGAIVIPAAVNVVNFMDGINGLCAGHAALWGIGALLASRAGGGEVLLVLGAISLGGGLGFLPWNVPHARLFLGDVGSYLIGGLAGIGVLAAALEVAGERSTSSSWLVLCLVCAPYLLFALDTGSTILRRAKHRENLFEAHRDHVYQRLANGRGAPHWVISLVVTSLSMVVTFAFATSWALGLTAAALLGTVYLASPHVKIREVTA